MHVPLPLLIATIINGIIIGSMYALFASGLTLIWGTMKMLNFAHGAYFMIGGYVVYMVFGMLHLNPVIATIGAIAAVFILSVIVERLVLHRLMSRPLWQLTTIIATLGVMVFLQNAALHIWGPQFKTIPYFIDGVANFFGVRIAYQRLLILAVSVVSVISLWALFKYSRFGMALRATSQDPEAAQLYGVNTLTVYTLTYGLSAALAGLAAAMLAPITSVNPFMGLDPLLKGFVVVILGGLGSFTGAIVGGIVLGVLEALGVLYTSAEWRDVVAFCVLIAIIWIRPWGLLGVEERS